MKKKILFVGSFLDRAKDGSVGGQMYACNSLMSSSLSVDYKWYLLDTSGRSVPPPPVFFRLFDAIIRIIKFVKICVFNRPSSVLIFSGSKPSIYEKGAMVIIASIFRIKVILAPRGGMIAFELSENNFLRRFVRFIFLKSNYVICQGLVWKEIFSKIAPDRGENKYVIIPNWIEVNNYNTIQMFNYFKEDVRVLFMGWMHEEKGVMVIMDAIEKLDVSKKVKFIFLGDGAHRNKIIDRSKTLGDKFKFEFPGWVYNEDKLNYIHNSDIYLLPSYAEGLPNALMEAMVSGVASIATNVGAIPDLITNNETGLLIDAGDSKALADSISLLINDPTLRERLAKNGQQRIIQNHSIDSAVERLKKIL